MQKETTQTTESFNNLTNEIKDVETSVKNDLIKVLRLHRELTDDTTFDKRPIDTDYFNKPSKLEQLKEHDGNFGVCVGYNHKANGKSLAGIDIDGYTLDEGTDEEKESVKQFTKKHIYECLKQELGESLQVSTQSNGFHLYLWNETIYNKIHETSNNLYFPQDFEIKELRGKSLENSIEIFTKFKSKQMVLPSSKTKYGQYKNIGTVNKLSDVATVKDINKAVIDALTKHGYTYKPPVEKPVKAATSNRSFKFKQPVKNKHLKELNKREVKKVVKMVAPLFKTIKDEKHIGALAIGGFFSNNITFESSQKIANGIIHKVGSIFKSNAEFKKTILKNYNERENIENKTGLPRFCELVLKKDSNFNATSFMDRLNKVCNNSFKKEIVGDVTINENQIAIYLYETELKKWLKYEEVFKGIDLILNPTELIGAFRYTKTDKEIISFSFKFKNYFFDIKKIDLQAINDFLENSAKVKLPTFFIETIRTSLNNLNSYAVKPKELSNEVELKTLFKERKRESYAQKQLGNYLHKNGVVIRKSVNTAYKLNFATNGFDSVEIDDLIEWLNLNGDFEPNSISTNDIKNALTYIGDRRKPTYDVVKFNNCLYDLENFRIIEETDEPILTLTEVKHNYNPNAKGVKMKNFLETSLRHRTDDEEKVKERVNAFFEFVGYILTSGNPLNCWFIFAGIGGAGKGVATNIITAIFGSENVGHLQVQELTVENRFATSNLVNKQINIVTDSPKKPIEETGLIKAITGYDDIPIEFKGKDKSILPKEEVPDMLLVCNNAPRFADGFDVQLIQRIIIFEFLNQFRNTDKQNKNLLKEILADPQEMEYLLYNGIEAYKKMIQNGGQFKARVSEEKTIELLGKHTNPINYLLPKLVKVNYYANKDGEEPVLTNELNELLLYAAKLEGLSITQLNDDGKIKPRTLLKEIRKTFDFDENYTTTTTKDGSYKTVKMYPNLCKTWEYNEYLTQMEEEKEKEENNEGEEETTETN